VGRVRAGHDGDRTEGMTKLVLDPQSERVLGVGIVAPARESSLPKACWGGNGCSRQGHCYDHPSHPTLSETVMAAAEVFFGTAPTYTARRSKFNVGARALALHYNS